MSARATEPATAGKAEAAGKVEAAGTVDARGDADGADDLAGPTTTDDDEHPQDDQDFEDEDDAGDAGAYGSGRGRTVRRIVGVVLAAALLVAAGAVGHARFGDRPPGAGSVDAGFTQDMIDHHAQAVLMAMTVHARTSNPTISALGGDIALIQEEQIGRMHAWLRDWSLPAARTGAPMRWMRGGAAHLTADGRMPGMASTDQIALLNRATGRNAEILFLQLMVAHHKGGVVMARYAADHAGTTKVRDLAQDIVITQSAEITQMEELLRDQYGAPITAPGNPPADAAEHVH